MDTAVDAPKVRCSLALQVGERIRKLRKRHGLTLQQAAQLYRTSPQSAQRFERGKMTVSLDWLERIAEAFSVEPYELLLPDGVEADLRKSARQDLVRLFCQAIEATYGEEELRR